VALFVADALGGDSFGNRRAIGWERDGQIVAGAVFHDWNPAKEVIEISVAGNGAWITRPRVREMFSYPFGFCRMVWGKTESPVLRRAWRHLGGDEYDIPGLWTALTLTREQWLRYCDGKRP
jgi:hypothetical protein